MFHNAFGVMQTDIPWTTPVLKKYSNTACSGRISVNAMCHLLDGAVLINEHSPCTDIISGEPNCQVCSEGLIDGPQLMDSGLHMWYHLHTVIVHDCDCSAAMVGFQADDRSTRFAESHGTHVPISIIAHNGGLVRATNSKILSLL